MVNSCQINKIFCNTWVEFTARPYFNCNHKKEYHGSRSVDDELHMLEYVPLIPIQKRINMLLVYTRNLNALMLSNASKVIKSTIYQQKSCRFLYSIYSNIMICETQVKRRPVLRSACKSGCVIFY